MVGVVTENENTDESESDPSTCEVQPDWALITCIRFALAFDSFTLFLSLILGQSSFHCPIYAEGILILLQISEP